MENKGEQKRKRGVVGDVVVEMAVAVVVVEGK
jgi:hypothetical protein